MIKLLKSKQAVALLALPAAGALLSLISVGLIVALLFFLLGPSTMSTWKIFFTPVVGKINGLQMIFIIFFILLFLKLWRKK